MSFLVGLDLNDVQVQTDSGNASTTAFTLDVAATTNSVAAYISGVRQLSGTDFTVSGTTITFTTAPPTGTNNIAYYYTKPAIINTPADNSVTTAKIVNNAVDETKFKDALIADFTEVTIAAGDSLLIGDVGDSGNTKRDTVQGLLDLVSGGGWAFVSATTASSSATVAFTGLQSGYDHLITFSEVLPASDNQVLRLELGVTGPTYRTSSYLGEIVEFDGTSQAYVDSTSAMPLQTQGSGNAADEYCEGEIVLRDAANSGSSTTSLVWSGGHTNGATFNLSFGRHFYSTDEAHTAVQILFASGNIATGEFKLYKRLNA